MTEQDDICNPKWEAPRDKSSVDSAWSWVRLPVAVCRLSLCPQAQLCDSVSRGSIREGPAFTVSSQVPCKLPPPHNGSHGGLFISCWC